MAFYPSEIFTHPRKTNLEICWFATIMSEKSFKKRYKSAIINKIDIIKTCQEIMEIRNDNRDKNGIKSSSYLSSQLMCGITKLHSYQTKSFEKEVLKIQQKLYSLGLKKKNDSDDEDEHDTTKLSDNDSHESASDVEIDLQLDENLHLLPDHDLETHQLQMRMDALCQDFGAFGSLTDMKLDIMPGHDIEHTISSLEKKLRNIHYSQETVHQERYSSQTSISELVDVSEMKAKSKESLTPQKRVPQNPSQIETPTKRRRLSFTDIVAVPSTKAVTVEEIGAPISPLQIEPLQALDSTMQLQPLDSSLDATPRVFGSKASKKIIDKKLVLNKQLIQKWRQDLHYKCRKSDLMKIHQFTPASDLLKQFSHGKRCADVLHNLFKKHITGPFRSNIDESIVPAELMQTEEALRVEETASRLNLPTELSTFRKDATITADGSALGSFANIPIMDDYPNALDTREALVMPPSETSLHSEISASPVSHDILAQLEVFWCDQEYVDFNMLISNLRRPKDITAVFHILLELHAEQKIVLVQNNCHDTLLIKKYNEND
ncbi:uncharacterized protein [Anoplolepis gracilipes]|uniref:uncharacterized protein n=1 Tax=Anoplolepis gracilipes TaxID=354296 RepID=UPI003BA11F17